jgi:thiamine-phosphate pyrophosphorylase
MTDKRIALRKRFTNVDIYPVTCEPLSNGRSDIDVLNNIVQAGVKIIQLRDKLSSKKVYMKRPVLFEKFAMKMICC